MPAPMRLILVISLPNLLSVGLFATPIEETAEAFYKRGLEYKQKGHQAKALGTWLAGRHFLEKQGQVDPRLAFAFLETATEAQAEQYYELACEMYFWGLSGNRISRFKQALAEEVGRTLAILSKDEQEEWRRLLDLSDLSLQEKIRSFWTARDPTPSTARNERLLEHWERIAYAGAHFRKARNTAYDSDDRGVIYIKYGKPHRIITGTLGANRAALKTWISVILDSPQNNQIQGGEGSVTADAVDQSFLLQEIDRFNNFPEYEIWFYQSLDADHPVFFLFGNREGIGRFGLRSGVEDLIPSRAFLISNSRNTNGIAPGAVLQSVYYSELMHLDPFFEDRFHELEVVWQSLNSQARTPVSQVNKTFRLKRQQYEIMDAHDPVYAAAPLEKSDFHEMVSEVALTCYPFRYLDDQDKPKLALTVFSFPKFGRNLARISTEAMLPEHFITNSIIARDFKQKELQRFVKSLPPGAEYVSTFIIDHDYRSHDYVLSTEVFSQEIREVAYARVGEVDFSPVVMAVGRKEIVVPPPLAPSANSLQLSDLVIGVSATEGLDSLQLPSPVVPSNRILATDPLSAYLEVYHLEPGEDGIARFSIDCEVGKVEGKKRTKKESLSVSFELSSAEPTSKESFEMDISKLSAGSYELIVTVKAIQSGQVRERRAGFDIYDEDSRL